MFGRLEDACAPVEITGVNFQRAEREDSRGKPGFWLERRILPLEILLVRQSDTPKPPAICMTIKRKGLREKAFVRL